MAKWTSKEVKRQVYGQVVALLRQESLCDIDETEFIDRAVKVQDRLAVELEKRIERIGPA